MNTTVTIGDALLRVTIALQGGELRSLQTADGTELLWQGDDRYWVDRAPNLFPYVGRSWKGTYRVNDTTYPMTIHGFIHQQLLHIEEQTDSSLTLVFRDTDDTRAVYPFRFTYTLHYRVTNGGLEIAYRVDNTDTCPLYFGIGGHPGFRVPLEEGLPFEAYRLQFDEGLSPVRLGFSDLCFRNGQDEPFALIDGRYLPLTHDLFDDDAIVLRDCGHTVTLSAPQGRVGVKVSFPDMPYLGLWHRPHTDAPYVCIEPWASLPAEHGQVACWETQPDLITLQPNETYHNRWSIQPTMR